jgi:hypothetical protein
MIKYCYWEYSENGDKFICKTKDEIKQDYYPFWLSQVIKVKGEAVAYSLSFDDCLADWIDSHWAVEVD